MLYDTREVYGDIWNTNNFFTLFYTTSLVEEAWLKIIKGKILHNIDDDTYYRGLDKPLAYSTLLNYIKNDEELSLMNKKK